MRPYQRERAPGGGGGPPPNYPNMSGNPAPGPNMPAPHPRNIQGPGLPGGNVRAPGQGIPRASMGPHPNHMQTQQQQQMAQNNSAPHMVGPPGNPAPHMVGPPGNPASSRAHSGPPGSRPKPLPGISGSKMAAGRVNQGRHPGMPGFHGQMPGTALSGSETDVSTSTENLTQVNIKLMLMRTLDKNNNISILHIISRVGHVILI